MAYYWCFTQKCFMPFCAFFTAFTVVMTLLVLSTDFQGRRFISFQSPIIWDFETWPQDSPKLIEIIRRDYLHPPMNTTLERPLEKPPPEVANLFYETKSGIFMECGADSQESSLTEWLELVLDWKGLVTQEHPQDFIEILSSRRPRMHIAPVCISPSSYPKHAQVHDSSRSEAGNLTTVPCFPLYSLMEAYNTTHLDLLSFTSIKGELFVLKTLPVSKVNIMTISFMNNEDDVCCSEEIKGFLTSWGYRQVSSCPLTSSRCYYICNNVNCPVVTV